MRKERTGGPVSAGYVRRRKSDSCGVVLLEGHSCLTGFPLLGTDTRMGGVISEVLVVVGGGGQWGI